MLAGGLPLPVDSVIRNRVLISGRVQGVCFRDSYRAAGPPARGEPAGCATFPTAASRRSWKDRLSEVHRLVDWAHQGPSLATVTGVTVREERPEGLATFVIK